VEIVRVGLGDRSYDITIGTDCLSRLGELCRGVSLSGKAAVITNPTVAGLYLDAVRHSLQDAGYEVAVITIPDGEEFKNAATLETIYDRLLAEGLHRGAFIVALGGGVVGDIAGYAAATFLRGIPFVQVPTTLLAQVDSSVGGKTGINHPRGKNLIGAFYQPRLVLIDLLTLDTLPWREYLCGLAEALKYGIVLDRRLFDYISSSVAAIKAIDKNALLHVVAACCSIKASVVERDEREGGLRAVLNYGHTIGHAVETLTEYKRFKHGEAVAIGMAQIAVLSRLRGLADADETRRIISLMEEIGFPLELPTFSLDEYAEVIGHDKKKSDDGVSFIFNRGVGGYSIEKVKDLRALLANLMQVDH
jgi:3-dehydroquinate synthase